MDYLFHFSSGIYGGKVLVGANLNLFWWFVAAGAVAILGHAISSAWADRRKARMIQRDGGG